MKIEHVAFNVANPVAMAAWYCKHLNFKIARHIPQPTQTHFLADETGETVLEIYHNPPSEVPDYPSMNPLLFHLALVSQSPSTDADRLITAGASWVNELQLPDTSHLVMLRDPWGIPLQLCKRATPLVRRA